MKDLFYSLVSVWMIDEHLNHLISFTRDTPTERWLASGVGLTLAVVLFIYSYRRME